MTLKELLLLKLFCVAVSNAQIPGLDSSTIHQDGPRNPGALIDPTRFNGPGSLGGFADSFQKSQDGVQLYSFIAENLNNLKSSASLSQNDKHDQDIRANIPQGPSPGTYSSSSNESPMIFAFRLEKRMWEEDLRNRVNSLRNVDFVDEMEYYAKPSIKIGRLIEWFKGMRGRVQKTSANSGGETDHYRYNEPPVYYNTETVRNFYNGPGSGYYPGSFDDSKDMDVPLSNILKQTGGKGRPNFNPQCNKGGSMIFCNSDALMGILDILESHMGNPNIEQYVQNVNFLNYDGYGMPMIQVIEMDPHDGHLLNPNKGDSQRSKDFNPIHDIDPFNENYNSHKSHGLSGSGIVDPNEEVEVVLVVHPHGGSFFKNNYNYGTGNSGGYTGIGGYGNWNDLYRKPFQNFEDDKLQYNHDKKFDHLEKLLDIVKQRNNNGGAGNFRWKTDSQLRLGLGGNVQHGHGNAFGNNYGNPFGFEISPERQLGHGVYEFGDYIPFQNANRPHSHKRPGNPNYFNNGELYFDIKYPYHYNYRRERNSDRGPNTGGEKYFGLARAGKSKHASEREREKAIRKKLEQLHVPLFPSFS